MAPGQWKIYPSLKLCRNIRKPSSVANWPFRALSPATANMSRTVCGCAHPEILWLLRRPKSHLYICGLKGFEEGVDEALIDITRTHGINWLAFESDMHVAGRYHVEVY